MPLLSSDPEQARQAYATLETRTLSAEQRAARLQDILDRIGLGGMDQARQIELLRQRVANLEAENTRLQNQVQELTRQRTDIPLQTLIAALGLAAAVGEASMADRSVSSIAADLQAHVALRDGSPAITFQPPELGVIAQGLSSTAFEIVKIPPQSGVAAPRTLYVVLEEKQRVYTDPFWTPFPPAARIIAAITAVFASTGAWDFKYLAQAAAQIASLENNLANSVGANAPGESVAAYRSLVTVLQALANALIAKANPVAGDLYALTAALDTTTRAAKNLQP